VRTLPLTPPKGGSKSEFVVFVNKIHSTKFLCVKTFSGKVVVEPFPILQCFYVILFSSHLLTSLRNFTEIVLGETLHWGLKARGVAKYRDVGHVEGYISETLQDMASGTVND